MTPLSTDRDHLSYTPDMALLESGWVPKQDLNKLPVISIGGYKTEKTDNGKVEYVDALICKDPNPYCLICTLIMCSKHPRT